MRYVLIIMIVLMMFGCQAGTMEPKHLNESLRGTFSEETYLYLLIDPSVVVNNDGIVPAKTMIMLNGEVIFK